MKDLYVIGAGGFGRETAWLAERINLVASAWKLCGFIDDDEARHGSLAGGYEVLGGCDYLAGRKQDCWAACAIGNPFVRRSVADRLSRFPHIHFATLIDPDVRMSEHVSVGEGSIICAGTILTVDVSVGRHVIINLGCTVGHDAVLEDFVTLYPGAHISGNVEAGCGVEIGTGVQIIQGKTIGNGAVVGAGAVVVKDVPPDCTAVGNPAGILRMHEHLWNSPGGGVSGKRLSKQISAAFKGAPALGAVTVA